MEPVWRRSNFIPPQTPLTRRLLAYFRSGAYTSGQNWTTRVFDTLFCVPFSNGSVGLLNAVRLRCESSGQVEAFRAIVGDGTLWTALLAGVLKTAWGGANSGIKRAFALRKILLSRDLLASAAPGRISNLLTNIERKSGVSSFLVAAREATAILTDIEKHLNVNWGKFTTQQLSFRPAHVPGNALFHPTGGWAFVIDQDVVSDETKVRVYRQNIGAPEIVGARAFRQRRTLGAGSPAGGTTDQAATIEYGMDSATGGDFDGVRQTPQQALADLASSPSLVSRAWLRRLPPPPARVTDWRIETASAFDRTGLLHRIARNVPGSCILSCGKCRTPGTERPYSRRP